MYYLTNSISTDLGQAKKIKNVYLQKAKHNIKISHCSKLYIKIILFKNFLI